MTWATWRMERALYLVTVAVLALVATLLAIAGLHQAAAWTTYSALHCSQPGSSNACMSAADSYYGASRFSSAGVVAGLALPGIVGLLVGVPVVAREVNQGTNRFAWTQSWTRTRWLVAKMIVGAVATAGLMAAMSPVFQWWTSAVQRGDRIVPPNFDVSGIVLVAYGLFAFVLGVLLGALFQRTGWAFAAGLPLFAGFRYLERTYVRPHLLAPVSTTTTQLAGTNNWVLNEGFLPIGQASPAHGQTWNTFTAAFNSCTNPASGKGHSWQQCVSSLRLDYVFSMQPGSHYWSLQLAEAGVFVALSAALFALAVVAVRSWRT